MIGGEHDGRSVLDQANRCVRRQVARSPLALHQEVHHVGTLFFAVALDDLGHLDDVVGQPRFDDGVPVVRPQSFCSQHHDRCMLLVSSFPDDSSYNT